MVDKIWPSDWPCKLCNRRFKQHIQIGTPKQEQDIPGNFVKAKQNWCFPWMTLVSNNAHKNTWKFTPIDNLTYVELKAKKKG